MNKIPPYFKDKSIPIILYFYNSPIAFKSFNYMYKRLLQDLEIEDFKAKTPEYTCKHSPFKYDPSEHVITGDLNIIENESHSKVFN